jgi:TetR/AcrR family transcriptional regulator of autoinduction and epiphytic fitness
LKDDKPKRIRRAPETTRGLILEATERIMIEEGYAAVSSRRVAQDLGLNAATIHYYYPTTDDLFVALHQRMTERQCLELEKALTSDKPLEALWTFQSEWGQTALGVEFLALSNHRKAIQKVIAGVTDEARVAQATALQRAVGKTSIDSRILPPIALVTIVVAIARTLANEERVGITRGHAEVRAFVSRALEYLLHPASSL